MKIDRRRGTRLGTRLGNRLGTRLRALTCLMWPLVMCVSVELSA